MGEQAIVMNGWAAGALASVLREMINLYGYRESDGIDTVSVELSGINWHVTVVSPTHTRRAIIDPLGNIKLVESFDGQ